MTARERNPTERIRLAAQVHSPEPELPFRLPEGCDILVPTPTGVLAIVGNCIPGSTRSDFVARIWMSYSRLADSEARLASAMRAHAAHGFVVNVSPFPYHFVYTGWATVFNDLKCHGCIDIMIAPTHGLKGMGEALVVVFPRAHQFRPDKAESAQSTRKTPSSLPNTENAHWTTAP